MKPMQMAGAPFQPFALEEWQSRYEQGVVFQLADSGVDPVRLRELVDMGVDLDALLDLPLHYPEVNGTLALRRRIAALYPGQSEANVLVTVGAAEANALVVETLAGAGGHVVAMAPSYPQVEGIARNRSCAVDTFPLDPADGWRPDLDQLGALVTSSTTLIAICNPNNPTGRILDEDEMERIVDAAGRTGAWILADEVYAGTELSSDVETPTFVGRYERVIAVNSMSKAYGLSGLRLGWIVAPEALIDALWRRHEYLTIATSALSMALAEAALAPPLRSKLLARSRGLIWRGADILGTWVAADPDRLSMVAPAAAAFGFVRIRTGESSTVLAERLRQEASVLVAPGACFGFDDHVRICHAMRPDRLPEALERISARL